MSVDAKLTGCCSPVNEADGESESNLDRAAHGQRVSVFTSHSLPGVVVVGAHETTMTDCNESVVIPTESITDNLACCTLN